MSLLKSRTDLRSLEEAGRIAAEVLDALLDAARPGVSTLGLETMANRELARHRSSAPFKQFDGFNQAICVSLNDEIVNGPPNRERILKENDLVSIAIGTESRGIHGKAARTKYLGHPVPEDIQRLLTGTEAVFARAIEASKTASTLNEVLAVVPATAEAYGLTLIEKMGGAGIGKKLHQAPIVPNNPSEFTDPIPLQVGMAFTMMPMMSLGQDPTYRTHEDKWTLITSDGALSAHFAETLLMTENGLVITTTF